MKAQIDEETFIDLPDREDKQVMFTLYRLHIVVNNDGTYNIQVVPFGVTRGTPTKYYCENDYFTIAKKVVDNKDYEANDYYTASSNKNDLLEIATLMMTTRHEKMKRNLEALQRQVTMLEVKIKDLIDMKYANKNEGELNRQS